MSSWRQQYNATVEALKNNIRIVDLPDLGNKSQILYVLSKLPHWVHHLTIDKHEGVESEVFEIQLVDNINDPNMEDYQRCMSLLANGNAVDHDEYSKFIRYWIDNVEESKLRSTYTSLNTIKTELEHGQIPNDIPALKKILAIEPYSYTKLKITELLIVNNCDIGINCKKFITKTQVLHNWGYGERCYTEFLLWNVIVASNLFITLRFDTFVKLTGYDKSELVDGVCKLLLGKKIIANVDLVDNIITFPVNKIDLQAEINGFFKKTVPEALERDWDALLAGHV